MEPDLFKKFSSLQEISKAQLLQIFSVNPNRKYLIIEPSLIKPLERVCGVQWLRESGIEKLFKLESVAPTNEDIPIFYMIPPEFQIFNKVVDQIRAQVNNIENPPNNRFHIIVIPRDLYIFQEELEQYGLLDSAVKLHSFQWMPLHLDNGILSLEIPLIYKTLFVYENYALMPVLSKALWQLSFIIGKPNVILALGQHSNTILQQYDELCETNGDTDKLNAEFGALLIIDRNVDYSSAFLTPGTYAGLLNEVYSVKAGICEYKIQSDESAEAAASSSPSLGLLDEKCNPIWEKKPVSINLNSELDTIYADIKNRYFTEVTSVLSNLTKQLKNEKTNSQEMSLDEMKHYVKTQLQNTKARKHFISNHLLAAESIINIVGHRYEKQKEIEIDIMKNSNKSGTFNYLEEITATENDMLLSLRLFCLINITQQLSDNEIRTFWRKFLHQFGFEHGYAMGNLIELGIVINNDKDSPSSSSSSSSGKINLKIPKFSISNNNFYSNAKNLKQIPNDPDKINLKHPTCASYVYGGAYIPLITQISAMILNSIPLDEILNKLEHYSLDAAGAAVNLRNSNGYPLLQRKILIYLIGGITYAEIAACNLLEILTGSKICFLSDRIISGNDLVFDILSKPG